MINIKSIDFSEDDKDSISQGGFVSLVDDVELPISRKNSNLEFRDAGLEDNPYFHEFDESSSTGVTFSGTTRTLEELLSVNKVAYSVLEREVIVRETTEGIIGLRGKIDLTFISLSVSLFVFSILNIIIYLFRGVHLINPFYSIFILVGSIGWFFTALLSIQSKKDNAKKIT